MPILLDLSRSKSRLHDELVRRIGYTEGLYGILRFAEIMTALNMDLPLPAAAVDVRIQSIVRSDKTAQRSESRRSYGEGIRNVAIALKLFERVGNRVALASRGRALATLAATHGPHSEEAKALLRHAVIVVDGDYCLNLFGIDAASVESAGAELFRRFRLSIGLKRSWLARSAAPLSVRRFVETFFDDVERGLDAGRRAGGRRRSSPLVGLSENTFRHTVSPRRGWIDDLGLGTADAQDRILDSLGAHGQRSDGVVALGLSPALIGLGLDQFPVLDLDTSWRLASTPGHTTKPQPLNVHEVLRLGYSGLRLKSFNQVELEALFEYWAAILAARGEPISEQEFESQLDAAIGENPGRIWRLSARRAENLSGYVAIRQGS